MDKTIKIGDWVKVAGKGNRAFRVTWTKKDTAGVDGVAEPLSNIEKLDLKKCGISTTIQHAWYEKNDQNAH